LEELFEALYIDYTPREKNLDARSLSKVTEDALRQTPTVLFVGETRKKHDWKTLLEFAGSGHLVITTSHAGSVIEAMSRLFRDTGTTTASQRSEIARRVLGIINIRSLRPVPEPRAREKAGSEQSGTNGADSNVRALLPALWKNTPPSINNLIADGLASVLPARGSEHEIGYFGRTVFANRLSREQFVTPEFQKLKTHLKAALLKNIIEKAREWDMKGV
jgi:type II secretory ATPase GspE/PulE/Tfp pilus assembly ATPase PilB-like protein